MSRSLEPSSEAWLRRYVRQVVLPEIGEAGQRRLSEATVRLTGRGDALATCAVYLASAGVGALELSDPTPLALAEASRFPLGGAAAGSPRDAALAEALLARGSLRAARAVPAPPAPLGILLASSAGPPAYSEAFPAAGAGPVAQAEAALAADAILRRLAMGAAGASGAAPAGRVAVAADGTVRRAT